MIIKDWPTEEKPVEKLLQKGALALTDAELIAIILRTGTKAENVVEVSRRLLKKYNLEKLGNTSATEISSIKGIGKTKASQLISCFELGRRAASSFEKKETIDNAESAARLLIPKLSILKQEHFLCLLIDSRRRLIKETTVFIGSSDTTVIHPREIFRRAITENASGIILAHNHPTGDAEPSDEDIEVTKMLVKAGNLLYIDVLDHIIIGKNSYSSIRDCCPSAFS
ncbi:MAG: DNA repair protein RadC [Candidatus Woesearchaeota archaeon]